MIYDLLEDMCNNNYNILNKCNKWMNEWIKVQIQYYIIFF